MTQAWALGMLNEFSGCYGDGLNISNLYAHLQVVCYFGVEEGGATDSAHTERVVR